MSSIHFAPLGKDTASPAGSLKEEEGPYADGFMCKCNNPIAALAFVGGVVVVLYGAGDYGEEGRKALQPNFEDTDLDIDGVDLGVKVVVITLLSIIASLTWIGLMMCFARVFVNVAFVLLEVGSIAAAVLLTRELRMEGWEAWWAPAIVFPVLAVIIFVLHCFVHSYAGFAQANLSVALQAIIARPFILIIGILEAIGQAAIFYAYVVASVGISMEHNLSGGDLFGFWLASTVLMLWIYQTLENITRITTSSVVRKYWKGGAFLISTCVAYSDAWTINLGPAALGAAITSIVEAVDTLLTMLAARSKVEGDEKKTWLYSCIASCVSCADRLLECASRFAYAIVGLYNVNFFTAGGRVVRLFSSHGLDSLIHDFLIERILWAGCVFNAVLASILTLWWTRLEIEDSKGDSSDGSDELVVSSDFTEEAVAGVVAFGVSFFVSHMVLSIVTMAMTAVYVCFIECPSFLQQHSPDDFESLRSAWHDRFPSLFYEEEESAAGHQVAQA